MATGTEPDCEDDSAVTCAPIKQKAKTPGIWNPLPSFDTVKADGQLGNIQSVDSFLGQAAHGALPAVSWIAPSGDVSEHPPAEISAGQSDVTTLINTIMQGHDWDSTAICLAWDVWGGSTTTLRRRTWIRTATACACPGLVISPYVKAEAIDHQTLSFDAYDKFIEDLFLHGQRLDPATDARPDPRSDVRENAPQLGDLTADFNFAQPQQPVVVLAVHP